MNNKNAVVLINKASGITSFECLYKIKKCVNKKTGHCGTLDKFATGLIIACCGKYTKKVPLFMGMNKSYRALIEFGKETDTLDPEGEIINTSEIPSFETVETAVTKLTGEIMQVPPVYSAIHVNGKRSYQLIRNGQDVKLEPRKINIFESRIISYNPPFLDIELDVSKGTYIRSYAHDLGVLCNSCAYVKELCRTKIGPFSLDDAIDFDDTDKLNLCDEVSSELILSQLNNNTRV